MTATLTEADFTALVRRHQNPLYRYGRGLGLDHDTALDLVQESFIKAHARLHQCREAERAGSWLFRIFRNAVLDWAKNVRRTEVSLFEVEEPAGGDDLADGQALREALGTALAGLPPILREAFLLRHENGYSYEEIAEIAGTSLSAAKMRVARARDALREALDPDYGDVTGAGLRSS
jgi:RNA polymerase sigma-70 factor (ECF subfamily)